MWKSWRLALVLALTAAVVSLNLFPISDPDVWWHLKTGDLIWKTLRIPRADPFSYTIAGTPWVTFEWLSQLLFSAAFALGGAAALTALKACVAAAAFALFFRLGRAGFWSALLLCGAAWSSGYYSPRPAIFDPLFLGLLLNWLEDDKTPRGIPLRVVLLHALWANMHGGAALLGVAVIAIRAFSRADRRLLLTAMTSIAAMALNPHGLRIFPHLYRTLSFPGSEFIVEWRSLPSLLNRHGIFIAAALAAVAFSWRKDMPLCLTTLAFSGLGVWAVRYLPFFELCAAALCARALERRRPVKLAARTVALASMAAIAASFFAAIPRGVGLREDPAGAVEFLDRERVGGLLFNEYNLGGYLIWKGREVFVDGRNAEYGPGFLRDALHWYEPAVWSRLDERWRFDCAVIENAQAYRAQILDLSKDWALAYWDDAALVYLRREPANERILSRESYLLLKPNAPDYGYLVELVKDKTKRPKVMSEIDRAVQESRQNDNARLMRAYALELQGRGQEAMPDIEAAVKHSPNKPGPLISLAVWYGSSGDAAAAESTYEKALKLASGQEDSLTQAYINAQLRRLRSAAAQQPH